MLDNTLFYLVFASQLILLSYIVPRKIIERAKLVLTNYPPDSYPKLYPQPKEYYLKKHQQYIRWNNIVLVLGFISFVVLVRWDLTNTGYVAEYFPWLVAIIQFIPLMKMEFTACAQMKKMRSEYNDSVRKAELTPRSFRQYIDVKMLLVALSLVIVAIGLDLYWHDFEMSLGDDVFARFLAIILTNLYFIIIMVWQISRKKQDPYQSIKDRTTQLKLLVKTAIFTSIALSIFIISKSAGDVFPLKAYETSIISIYLQAIAWFGIANTVLKYKLEDIDFSVYKKQSV
jgi:cation transport ATPase